MQFPATDYAWWIALGDLGLEGLAIRRNILEFIRPAIISARLRLIERLCASLVAHLRPFLTTHSR
jgi:hypothetical protein